MTHADTIARPTRSVPAEPPVFADAGEERRYRLERLAIACRVFARFGFDEGRAGHITARDPEHPDRFWVNPLGLPFSMVCVSDLCLVDRSGDVVEGQWDINRAAFAIHSAIHAARPDVVAAAHAHSLHGKAWSTLRRPLDPITQDACLFYENQALYAEYHGIVTDVSEGDEIATTLGDNAMVILANHGLLTVGATVDEAAFYFLSAERSAHAQLLAEAAGTPTFVDDAVARRLGGLKAGFRNFQPYALEALRDCPDVLS